MCRAIERMNNGGTLLPISFFEISRLDGHRQASEKLPMSAISLMVR